MHVPFYETSSSPALKIAYNMPQSNTNKKNQRYEIIISNNSGTVDIIKGRIINRKKENIFDWIKRKIQTKLTNKFIQIKTNKDTRILFNITAIARHTGLKPKEIKEIHKNGFFKQLPKAISQNEKLLMKSELNYIKEFKQSPINNFDLLNAYHALPSKEKAKEFMSVNVCITEYKQDEDTHLLLTLEGDPPILPPDAVKIKDHNAVIWNWSKKLYVDSREHAKNYDKQIDADGWNEIKKSTEILKKLCANQGRNQSKISALKDKKSSKKNIIIPVTDPAIIEKLNLLNEKKKFDHSEVRFGFIVADKTHNTKKEIHLGDEIKAAHFKDFQKPFFSEVAIFRIKPGEYGLCLKTDADSVGKNTLLVSGEHKQRERDRLLKFCAPGNNFETKSSRPRMLLPGEKSQGN